MPPRSCSGVWVVGLVRGSHFRPLDYAREPGPVKGAFGVRCADRFATLDRTGLPLKIGGGPKMGEIRKYALDRSHTCAHADLLPGIEGTDRFPTTEPAWPPITPTGVESTLWPFPRDAGGRITPHGRGGHTLRDLPRCYRRRQRSRCFADISIAGGAMRVRLPRSALSTRRRAGFCARPGGGRISAPDMPRGRSGYSPRAAIDLMGGEEWTARPVGVHQSPDRFSPIFGPPPIFSGSPVLSRVAKRSAQRTPKAPLTGPGSRA